jgi:hypothetical protein
VPWVYEALGPEPSVEHDGLRQRWNSIAEHLAGVRIDRGVSEPTQTGITDHDILLVKDLRTLREDIELARELGMDAPGRRLMSGQYRPGGLQLPGLSRGNGQGFGIGD